MSNKLYSALVTLILGICVAVPLAMAASSLLDSGTYIVASTNTGVVQRAITERNLTVEIFTPAVSGTPSIVDTVQGLDSAGNAYTLCATNAITVSASAVRVIHLGPDLAASAAGNTGTVCNVPIPDKWRVNIANNSVSGVANAVSQVIYYNTAP